jgi:hypothetical protein
MDRNGEEEPDPVDDTSIVRSVETIPANKEILNVVDLYLCDTVLENH